MNSVFLAQQLNSVASQLQSIDKDLDFWTEKSDETQIKILTNVSNKLASYQEALYIASSELRKLGDK